MFGATVTQDAGASGTLASGCVGDARVGLGLGVPVTGAFVGCDSPLTRSSCTAGAFDEHAKSATAVTQPAIAKVVKRMKANPTLKT